MDAEAPAGSGALFYGDAGHNGQKGAHMLHFYQNLLIFGEGGDGGAGAAPGAAPAGQAADNGSGVTAPVAGEQRQLTKEERRAQRLAKFQAEQEKAQTQQQPAAETPAADLDKEFENLIKGKYKAQYDASMQKAVTGRVKNLKDSSEENASLKTENSKMAGLLNQLAKAQGIEPGADGKINLEAIEQFVEDARVEQYALENGVSDEMARKQVSMEKELQTKTEQIRQMQAEQQERENYAMYLRVKGAAEEAKKAYPDMDLDATVNDPRFAHLIKVLPPAAAYGALHQMENTTKAMQYAVNTTRAAAAATIQAGMARPSEGGLGRSATPAKIQIDVGNKAWRESIKRDARRGKFAEF